MKQWAREDGQGLVEYALILVLVAIVVIIILSIMGGSVAMVYARVMGGLNGQVITGVGEEFVVAGFDETHSSFGGTCIVTFTTITVIALLDGSANANNSAIPMPVTVNGSSQPMELSTDGSGIARVTGPVTYNGSCPLTVNMGGRTLTFN